jgi:hypothetical protein
VAVFTARANLFELRGIHRVMCPSDQVASSWRVLPIPGVVPQILKGRTLGQSRLDWDSLTGLLEADHEHWTKRPTPSLADPRDAVAVSSLGLR